MSKVKAKSERQDILTKVTWVGVHNRRGDYGNHLSKLYNLAMLGPDFFLLAMEHFTKKIPGPVSLKLVSGKPCHVGVELIFQILHDIPK